MRALLFSLPAAALALLAPLARPAQNGEAARAEVRAAEARRVAVLQKAARAVVCVFSDREATRGGSGVIIDPDGYGLTSFHVVADLLARRQGYGGLADGRLYPLRLLGIDPGGDIAMFRLAGRPRFDTAPLGDSDELRVGQPVAAMGNPFLLAEDFTPTITLGVVSGLRRYQYGQGRQHRLLEYADCIQISTSINPGNSGGPLFDMRGRLVGINGRASFADGRRGRVNVGLGYAVSINQIRRFLPALRAGQLCEHGTLGATVQQAGAELIFNVVQDLSAAERAGVRPGDGLLSLAGRPLRTPNDYNNLLATLPAGWPVAIVLLRQGRRIETTARLERLPAALARPYVLDLEHNHAEIRRLFRRCATSLPAAGADQPRRTARRARITRVRNAARRLAEVRLRREAGGRLLVEHAAQRLTLALGEEPFAAEAAPPAAEFWRDRAVWSEWQHVTAPLVDAALVGLGWELIGGDQVQGRVASIVEWRVSEGRRVRWAFDYQSGRLLEARVFDARRPGSVVWLPEQTAAADSACRPRRWTRPAGRDGRGAVRIELLGPGAGP